jgi:hypothetical protein
VQANNSIRIQDAFWEKKMTEKYGPTVATNEKEQAAEKISRSAKFFSERYRAWRVIVLSNNKMIALGARNEQGYRVLSLEEYERERNARETRRQARAKAEKEAEEKTEENDVDKEVLEEVIEEVIEEVEEGEVAEVKEEKNVLVGSPRVKREGGALQNEPEPKRRKIREENQDEKSGKK